MSDGTPLRFGIVREPTGRGTRDDLGRLGAGLSTALRCPVELCAVPEYVELLDELVGGAVDLAWMSPLVYMLALTRGARLLALAERGGATSYRSALLVRQDSPWRDATELHGARLAWVDRESASGHQVPRRYLVSRGLDPAHDFVSEVFYGSVQAAAAAVIEVDADVCACFVSEAAGDDLPWGRAQDDVNRTLGPLGSRLRVLELTDSIPSDGVVASPHLGDPEQARLGAALYRLHESTSGADVLRELLEADRLVPVPESLRRALVVP